jgi:hypothetical protein
MATLLVAIASATLCGCNKFSGSGVNKESNTGFDPCSTLREIDPHCGWKPHWEDSGPSVNQIDGAKTEFVEMDSSDPDGEDSGDLHYAALRLCFNNGKLCHGDTIGIGVNVHGMVDPVYDSEYSTQVRYRFDGQSPLRATWGISDNHETLFPSGHEKTFASELLKHKELVLEFSYYEKAPRTITFDLSGLDGALKVKGLSL